MKTVLTLAALSAVLLAWQVQAQCGAAAAPVCKAAAETAAAPASHATINPAGLDALLKAKVPVLVFDARSAQYDDGRRVPGARSLTAKASAEDVAAVAPDKNALVVTYCSNPKCPASAALAKHLGSLGYSNVVEMPEGIEGWVADGRPVDSAK
jgi:rhodanese-related sulfurtransferase